MAHRTLIASTHTGHAPAASRAPDSMVLPGFEVPAALTSSQERRSVDVPTYYVSVKLLGSDGSTRRGNICVDGARLRALAQHLGDGRTAREWIRVTVTALCHAHPQDFSLGSARWKGLTGATLGTLVDQAISAAIASGGPVPAAGGGS